MGTTERRPLPISDKEARSRREGAPQPTTPHTPVNEAGGTFDGVVRPCNVCNRAVRRVAMTLRIRGPFNWRLFAHSREFLVCIYTVDIHRTGAEWTTPKGSMRGVDKVTKVTSISYSRSGPGTSKPKNRAKQPRAAQHVLDRVPTFPRIGPESTLRKFARSPLEPLRAEKRASKV